MLGSSGVLSEAADQGGGRFLRGVTYNIDA
jgi:hypothetical protein